MSKLFKIIIFVIGVFSFIACHNDDNEEPAIARRTIIAYFCGDNDLSKNLYDDLQEIINASKSITNDVNLVAFVDLENQKPYIVEVKNGETKTIKSWSNDIYATSADNMHDILQTIISKYPAQDYGLIFGGHGSGALQANYTLPSTIKRLYAYGTDNSGDINRNVDTFINIPSMADVFSNLKDINGKCVKFSFLFFDCCCMQNIETDYEFANYADYIIAPLTEISAEGADYNRLLPLLTFNIESNVQNIINAYVPNKSFCASIVKTEHIDELLYQTRNAIHETYVNGAKDTTGRLDLDLDHCIYYFVSNRCSVLNDINDVLYQQKLNNKLSDESYDSFRTALNKVVVAKIMSKTWTNSTGITFSDFDINENTYGGINMIVPQNFSLYTRGSSLYKAMNDAINELEWGRKIGWRELGW